MTDKPHADAYGGRDARGLVCKPAVKTIVLQSIIRGWFRLAGLKKPKTVSHPNFISLSAIRIRSNYRKEAILKLLADVSILFLVGKFTF
jgi:hypothetical protein